MTGARRLPRSLSLFLLFTILSGCGLLGPKELVLEIQLIGVNDGDQLSPNTRLDYEVTASGYRDVTVEAVIDSGQIEREGIGTGLKGHWDVRGDFLKKAGRSKIFLRATGTPRSVDPSSPEAAPVTVASQSVFVEVNPKLEAITLLIPSAGETIALGEEVKFQVAGTDLWLSVDVHAMAVDGTDMPTSIVDSYSAGSGSATSWVVDGTLRKSLGKHRLRLVAEYGEQQVQSDPFEVEVLYVLDGVELLVRSPEGSLQDAGYDDLELRKVDDLVIRVSGRGLTGQTLEIFEGEAKLGDAVAPGDELDFVYKPRWEDFPAGQQKRAYQFKVTIGIFEEETGATLLRWGIIGCTWRRADGSVLGNNDNVAAGTDVHLTVDTWGFKSSTAEFVIKEEDLGEDDYMTTLTTPVTSEKVDISWKAEYDVDPAAWPFEDVHTDAEFYFTVQIEDLSCKSKLIEVPEP